MSVFDNIQHIFSVAEKDIVDLVSKAKRDLPVAVHDINLGLAWVANNTPKIAQDLTTAETLIVSTGVGADPRVAAAIVAANLAIQGLNAYSASVKSGTPTAQSVVDGYIAVKNAQVAAAGAAAAAASAPSKTA